MSQSNNDDPSSTDRVEEAGRTSKANKNQNAFNLIAVLTALTENNQIWKDSDAFCWS